MNVGERAPLFAPVRRLADLRRAPVGEEEMRTALGRAALEVAGELGYAELTVERVLERGGTSRSIFYRLFANAEECYLRGFRDGSEALAGRLLETCRGAESWPAALAAALAELGAVLVAETVPANALIAQVAAVGRAGPVARTHLVERLTAALDLARKEAPPGVSPPPSAAIFIFGAIEMSAAQALARRRPGEFTERVPDLTYLAVATYFGVEVARESAGPVGPEGR